MDVKTRREFVFLAVASVFCGMIPLLFPADVPWINDEPALFAQAWNVVHKMEMPSHGLDGNLGLPYGPVPVLIYAAALFITHNLVVLVFLRAFSFMLAISVAVWWLARMCRNLSPPVGVLALLSPYYWLYSRELWDNSFLIPFSALTLVTYISFCRTPAAWKLWLVGLGMVLMFQTHLMCLPLLASITCHFLWQYRSWAIQHARHCLMVAILGSCASLPYIVDLSHHLAGMKTASADWKAAPWFFALMEGKIFSAIGLDYFFGENWQSHSGFPVLLWILTGVSALGLIGFWIGAWKAGRFLLKNRGLRGDKPLEFHLWSVVCLTLVLQIIVNGVSRTCDHPHYHNATSFCVFTLLWFAYSQVGNSRWPWTVAGLHAVALLTVLLSIIWRIHETQGNINLRYGPTLRTQLDVLKELDFQNPKTVVLNETYCYYYFPQAFSVLQTLYPPHYSTDAPVRRLLIRYADPQAGAGRLIVVNDGQ
jgi:hypothetical protein